MISDEKIHREFKAWRKIYWESGVWRRFSFEDFINGVAKIMREYKKPLCRKK